MLGRKRKATDKQAPEETEEIPESFKKFAITEEYQVSATFKGHSTLKSLKYLSYHSKDLVLEFDRKLLETKQVIYDATKNTLLIKQVPVELIAELSNKN